MGLGREKGLRNRKRGIMERERGLRKERVLGERGLGENGRGVRERRIELCGMKVGGDEVRR